MKLIVPMAGKGTRLRPHTHVTPKPLLPVLGASMVEHIVSTFVEVLPKKIEEAVFILGPDFPQAVQDLLTSICAKFDIKASFGVQEEAKGTAHAIYCAKEHLAGEVISVFADTLFLMDKVESLEKDVISWVKTVEDPSRFGVIVRNEAGEAVGFVEKPQELISNEALIGIYYVKDGAKLRAKIEHIMDYNMCSPRGEYELTDAFDLMLKDGASMDTATVNDWLDCGTIPALVETTFFMMDKPENLKKAGKVENSILIEPVYIAEGARVQNSVLGPYVAIEANAQVEGSVLKNTILFANAKIKDANLADSVIGHHALVVGNPQKANIGDHSDVRI